ncbi:hypothetical protein EV359DRAFT_86937 [Lentinula novae-zelandiae]|nr:hypothetical protein EV359DRAFT_86937 [Lentinula novae-zelandiae]
MYPSLSSHVLSEESNLIDDLDPKPEDDRKLMRKLGASFFLFGLINNVLYVIILSAALDLVPPLTPTGIIAFCNIAPALVAKVGWPSLGMLVVILFDSLFARLIGIGLASFSSGNLPTSQQ